MNFNIVTHETPHLTKKECGCRCCRKYRITAFLPFVLEEIRDHVGHDQGYEIPMNIHRMATCLYHNRSLGSWYFGKKKISRARVASMSGLNIADVTSTIARADKTTFKTLKNQWDIIWKPDSYDGSRHVFIPEHEGDPKDACAVDFDMRPLTPAQLSDYIQIVMEKYNCNYAVLQYFKPKWSNPGVHFDVDTTRAGVVSKVM